MLELSKGPRKLRNRVDLMAWSMHVTTDDQQRSNQSDYQPKDQTIIIFSYSFEYSQMSQFWGGAWPLPECYLSYDFRL